MPHGAASPSARAELVVEPRRRFTGNRTWTLLVLRNADDPFGVVIHQEVVVDERRAKARVEEVAEGDQIGSTALGRGSE